MTDHEKGRTHPRTTPYEAVGETGDSEARRQADEAVVRRSDQDDRVGRGPDKTDGGGHEAKRQRPGIGREEQDSSYTPKP